MNLHDLITLMILPIGTSGYKEMQYIKYTSECILKLQIHQHLCNEHKPRFSRTIYSMFLAIYVILFFP